MKFLTQSLSNAHTGFEISSPRRREQGSDGRRGTAVAPAARAGEVGGGRRGASRHRRRRCPRWLWRSLQPPAAAVPPPPQPVG
eukprot:364659-Chlamydomonas_euryale.AAC.5